MSRAFVKELDGEGGEDLPELAVSPHRNLVTPSGLAQIERTLHRLEGELVDARAADDKPLAARIERDLRYFRQRKATAEVVPLAGTLARSDSGPESASRPTPASGSNSVSSVRTSRIHPGASFRMYRRWPYR